MRQAKPSQQLRCPACLAVVRCALPDSQRQVRCPSCLQPVMLEAIGDLDPGPLARPDIVKSPVLGTEIASLNRAELALAPKEKLPSPKESMARKVERLEERIAVLERLVASLQETERKPRLQWLAANPDLDLSPTRAAVLCHNLTVVPAHHIIIQHAPGDELARQRAEWFKDVFERARWSVTGPCDAPDVIRRGSLALATRLPVPPVSAATFMAIRAAGLPVDSTFDPDVVGDDERLVVA